MKNLKRWLALLCAVALCAALAGCQEETSAPTDSETETESESEPTVEAAYGENEITALSDYSVTELLPDDPLMRAVIAVDGDGEPCLTNSEMQIYYWLSFYNFMSSFSSYASQFGLDYTKPLAGQHSDLLGGDELTIEQYFLQIAVQNFSSNYALLRAAYADGYALPEDESAQIDDIADPDGDFAAQAAEQGYDSVAAYLQENFGDGVTIEAYQSYVRTLYVASDYYEQLEDEIQATLTDEAVEAYYDKNADAYAEKRLDKVNNVSARHILIAPEGDKDTELNDWTEEQWAAAQASADEVYALWQQDPTEENFAALAEEYSTDGGSNTNGGLYEDFASDRMVDEFSDWCFDPARVPGDTGIVRTPYGYHIMYFVGQTETRTWFETAKSDMLSEQLSERMDELRDAYPVRIDYAQIRLFDLITKATSGTAQAVG